MLSLTIYLHIMVIVISSIVAFFGYSKLSNIKIESLKNDASIQKLITSLLFQSLLQLLKLAQENALKTSLLPVTKTQFASANLVSVILIIFLRLEGCATVKPLPCVIQSTILSSAPKISSSSMQSLLNVAANI